MQGQRSSAVAGLARYPVKSMLGEQLTVAWLDEHGLRGDRAFAAVEGGGGDGTPQAMGSAKHPRKWGPLLSCRAETAADGEVRVTFPDGSVERAGEAALDKRLSALLGRPVRLSDRPDGETVLERALPEYEGGVPEAMRASARLDSTGTLLTSSRPAAGSFHDFGAVHVISTQTLTTLRRLRSERDEGDERGKGGERGDVDVRRFRPNLVVDLPDAGDYPEDAWVGAGVRIGGALLRGIVPTPRCVVPTLAHGELPADPWLMRTVARAHRVPVLTLGALSCVGVYLEVVEPGPVRIGDGVHPEG